MRSKYCLSYGSSSGHSTSLVNVYAFLTWRHETMRVLGGLKEALWTMFC